MNCFPKRYRGRGKDSRRRYRWRRCARSLESPSVEETVGSKYISTRWNVTRRFYEVFIQCHTIPVMNGWLITCEYFFVVVDLLTFDRRTSRYADDKIEELEDSELIKHNGALQSSFSWKCTTSFKQHLNVPIAFGSRFHEVLWNSVNCFNIQTVIRLAADC